VVQHLPKRYYHRRASYTPDGRRRDYWVFTRRATLHHLGDVTIVLSKKRRKDGPQGVKMLVTNLPEASAGAIGSIYAWRWGIELFQSQDIKFTRGYFFSWSATTGCSSKGNTWCTSTAPSGCTTTFSTSSWTTA
jgi:hypothetical protein